MPFLQPKVFREIKLHECEFNKEIPKIRVKTKPFRGVSRKSLVFNIMIPTIEKEIINLAVPNLTTKYFYGLKALNIHFNSELPEISVPPKTMFVPRIKVKTFSGVKAKEKDLISDIPQVLSGGIPLAEVIKRERGKEIAKIQEQIAAGVSGEEAEKELELPNFFELLLGKGVGRISEGEPICIIVEKTKEKLEELIKALCRDIYREKIGGKPTPIRKKTVEDLRIEWNSLVERKIIIIEEVEKRSDGEKLLEMLKGFFSQDMGFLILITSKPSELENEIMKEVISPNIIRVGGLSPGIEGRMEEILKIIRGKETVPPFQRESFGEEFENSVETFDKELKKYLNYKKAPSELKENWDRLTKCSPDDYAQASDVHSAMKAFVWMHEWKKSGKRKNPELETEDRGVDVKIEDRNYEIETLFGVGDIMSKLTEKTKKYGKQEKVYFVVRNLDILRNLPLFLSFKKDWIKAGYKVEFFGLDLDKEKLVPLKEFTKVLKSQEKNWG